MQSTSRNLPWKSKAKCLVQDLCKALNTEQNHTPHHVILWLCLLRSTALSPPPQALQLSYPLWRELVQLLPSHSPSKCYVSLKTYCYFNVPLWGSRALLLTRKGSQRIPLNGLLKHYVHYIY